MLGRSVAANAGVALIAATSNTATQVSGMVPLRFTSSYSMLLRKRRTLPI
jgi:hypothetical protein